MKSNIHIYLLLAFTGAFAIGCIPRQLDARQAETNLPETYSPQAVDTSEMSVKWDDYFKDPYLQALIDSALLRNQELNIVLQEIAIRQNEVLEKTGEYQPKLNIGLGAGAEKAGRFTRDGSVEHNLEIDEGQEFPEPLGDFALGARATWEVDIWRKLRNAKDAAQLRFLAQTEARNFLVTQLVSEIAEAYYELLALDNSLEIINRNLEIQSDALAKTRQLKQYAKANQLAVNRFEAQFLNTQNQQYAIKQRITEVENRLFFLTGSYRDTLQRQSANMLSLTLDTLNAGIPAQLLRNRPDIRKAELELAAAKIDVKVARADFYPRLDVSAGIGYRAFNPSYVLNPESMIYDVAGDLIAPLINRKAITARYNMASAAQLQAVLSYEQTVLQAYTDVLNQLTKLENYSKSVDTKVREVEVLNASVVVANNLFKFAKADYVEVLLTQEEALDAQMELVEAKLMQLQAKVHIYRALGGGWK